MMTPHSGLSKSAFACDLQNVEQKLGVTLLDDLTGVLSETNSSSFGLVAPGEDRLGYYCQYGADEILEENVRLREFRQDNLSSYEPCEDLFVLCGRSNR